MSGAPDGDYSLRDARYTLRIEVGTRDVPETVWLAFDDGEAECVELGIVDLRLKPVGVAPGSSRIKISRQCVDRMVVWFTLVRGMMEDT